MIKIAWRHGLYMFIGFTLIFVLALLSNNVDNYHIRYINLGIQALFIWLALKKQRRTHEGFQDAVMSNFPSGVALGMMTSVIAYFPFSLGVSIFLRESPDTMEALRVSTNFGEYLSPFFAGVMIFAEGVAFALIGSYIITRIIQAGKQPV